MDPKGKAVVAAITDRIRAGTYHEREVLCLLILLRPLTAAGTPFVEIAHFIAHRDRDRGAIYNYVTDMRRQIEVGTEAQESVIFSSSDFLGSLNDIIRTLGLEPLPSSIANDVLFCVMSLLQGIQFTSRDSVQWVGTLALGFTKGEVVLYGEVCVRARFMFRVFAVPNRYLSPRWEGSETIAAMLNGFVEVEFVQGRPVVGLASVERPEA